LQEIISTDFRLVRVLRGFIYENRVKLNFYEEDLLIDATIRFKWK
jgi:hypothetical protein